MTAIPTYPASLLNLLVETAEDLVNLNTGQLPEGARCVVQVGAGQGSLPGNREYVLTFKYSGTGINFTDGISASNNSIQPASGQGLWVAAMQLASGSLNGTTDVLIENLYIGGGTSGFGNARIAFNRSEQGAAPGFVSVDVVNNNSLNVVSSDASDDSLFTLAIFPAL